MRREELLRYLEKRARRSGPAEWVWWNGELIHVSVALGRASRLAPEAHVQRRGDDVLVLAELDAREER